jgi:hypothetical protein
MTSLNSLPFLSHRRNLTYLTSCFFGLNGHNSCVPDSASVNDLSASVSDNQIVAFDKYHTLLVLGLKLISDY